MSVKSLQIAGCILFVVLTWGAQSSFLLLMQKYLGPWKSMFFYGAGQVTTACFIGIIGCKLSGSQSGFSSTGAIYGLLAGATACLGGAGITLAFMYAGQAGNHVGSAWISPVIGGLLPISYVGMAFLLLPPPKYGWGQIFHPGYMLGIGFIIWGVVLVTIYRPK